MKADHIALGTIALILLSFVPFLMPSFLDDTGQSATEIREIEWEKQLQEKSINVVSKLFYVRDKRTGICFATRSVNRYGYLATVDCDKVPAKLLLETIE